MNITRHLYDEILYLSCLMFEKWISSSGISLPEPFNQLYIFFAFMTSKQASNQSVKFSPFFSREQ
ncbi:hypothetical protein KXD40_002829 [Peronospora effusa]|uniref:Uncharacterized protein n=1 Tax=Peronospora effusa TaxID=542832 RepID=A0A3M6VPC1_9STRA|nr:hypothetical protein DD238_003934 [Peronospora effusa]RQM09465.1 hypothetical protein DD237_003566 [Peronospora effusa]UIZ29536.1 hypothetical protein KXD40_002829 [Peronospora effusa]